MRIDFCIFFASLAFQASLFAQSIYAGGNGDGTSNSCYSQITNIYFSVYSGGRGDGTSTNCFSQLPNTAFDIYAGGNAGGFAKDCYTQLENTWMNIYFGGNADGTSKDCYVQQENTLMNIYFGGVSDGFSNDCYTQQDNQLANIFRGGRSDGLGINCVIADVGPLPVEFLYFLSNCENSIPVLRWATAYESNNESFTIERSTDGRLWNSIGNVAGAGNSIQTLEYQFSDFQSGVLRYYYRLRQQDYNGRVSYSTIISSGNCADAATSFVIFPNPSTGKFTIQTMDPHLEITDLRVFSAHGQLISENLENGQLDLSEYQSGVYVLEAIIDQQIIRKTIVLNR